MRASAAAVVEAAPPGGWRLTRAVDAPPVAWRRAAGQLWMVGTSASPVGDDDVAVALDVGAGAVCAVRSVAATVAWSGRGSRQRTSVTVADGACLDWAPQPLVATARCDHTSEAAVHLGPGARLRWVEQLVLGRSGESPGRLRADLRVDVGGLPLLRHSLVLGGPVSPAVLGDAGAVGLVLVAGPGVAPPAAAGEGWAVMPLAGPGAVALAVGADALAVADGLCAAESALRRGQGR